MMRFLVPVFAAAGLIAFAASEAPSQSKKEAAELFSGGKVLEIAIEIAPKEMDALRREPRKYAKATIKEGGKVYTDVGIHLKGAAGSFRGVDDKANFTLNMDKFNDGQSFHGLDKWHLANSLQDPSYLNEWICGEMFRDVGVPASRVAHATVTVNGQKRGLYYIKEGYDTVWIKRNFGSADGNFYDGGFCREIDQPLQKLSGKNDVPDQKDVKALLEAAREGDAKKRFAKLEKVLDIEKFLSYLAMEVITWDWDGYPMNRNNYRVFHDPKKDKIVFIPSGMDQMFGDPNGPIIPNIQGFVARQFLETPEGKERYYKRLSEIMEKNFKAEAYAKKVDEMAAKLQPVLTKIDAGAGRDHPNHARRLRDAIVQREKVIQAQLKQLKK
ncbi:MAG: CotH kinase family protein [Gemmataceae bacterium]|nr:CotH kinase family protein [Gemmataceae bacterium]